jgi:peptidoglycan/LPS O-acetylase OafA/YrhL
MIDGAAPHVDTEGLASGDESGTAPGDRRFRPDVEGLRAVAILLVVLYHGGLGIFRGGYVGVDVFFVISGFVITGVLLRERASGGRTSLLGFYGRRSRRILPAATLVIVVTVIATYLALGALYGNPTAIDARWTAVFLANFHFSAVGSNYLTSHEPPSPLLNFWSLAVEEQFYLVYPAFFLVLAGMTARVSVRARLMIGLLFVIGISFAFSVVQTASEPTAAYFSPFSRAWELALGALVAVSTQWLLRVPKLVAAAATWIGLIAIVLSAIFFDANTSYPGWSVVVPVLGAGLVIAGGVTSPRGSCEALLGLRPFRWLGRLSYSLYLWHWPILIIVAEEAGKASLPFHDNLPWLVLALVASVLTYHLLENPVRHAPIMARGWIPIGAGILMIAASLTVATVEYNVHSGGAPPSSRSRSVASVPVSLPELGHLVADAPNVRFLPANLYPSLAQVREDWGGPPVPCWLSYGQVTVPPGCVYGDPHGTRTMVVFGDSHAAMWLDSLSAVATQAGWRLVYLGKGSCPASDLPVPNPPGWGRRDQAFSQCEQFHRYAVARIDQLKPNLVIITQEIQPQPGGKNYSTREWQDGLAVTLRALTVPKSDIYVLGNIPTLHQSGPECLAHSATNIQACSDPATTAVHVGYNGAEKAAAEAAGAHYIDVTPWFCSRVCTAVIGGTEVYWDDNHITAGYAFVLERVLGRALGIETTSSPG